jgi:hypothetical protein
MGRSLSSARQGVDFSMMIDYDVFSKIFLTGTNLQNVICHLCNQGGGLVSDPITETLSVMATTPISLVITEAGVAMFKNKPTMVFPYSNMNSEQLLYITKLVDTLVQNSTEENLKLKGHVQMGGGCIIVIPTQTHHQDFIVKKNDLLHAFVESVYKSQRNNYTPWTKKALCSIILQRLSCTTNLPKDILNHATAHSETLFSTSSPILP